MAEHQRVPPKFVPRYPPKAVSRSTAFASMRKASKRPVVWIHAPAGTGKSTLAAGFLKGGRTSCVWYNLDRGDRDPASFLPQLAERFALAVRNSGKKKPAYPPFDPGAGPQRVQQLFRVLWASATQPLALVLDDWHEMGDGAEVGAMLADLIHEMGPEHRLYVISQKGPPGAIARYLADSVSVVRWDEIRFSDVEAIALIRQRNSALARALGQDKLRALNRYTRGWVYALILLVESAADPTDLESRPQPMAPKELIDFLASQVFTKLSGIEREVLGALALLPGASSRAVARLTGLRDSGRALEALASERRLVDRLDRGHYQLHPLLRTFLLEHLPDSTDTAAWTSKLGLAAEIAASERMNETAVELLIEACDWPGVVRLLLGCAGQLLSEGRHLTVRRWIEEMPEDAIERQPWLEFWLGASVAPFDPNGAQRRFASAYAGFERCGDVPGMFASCAAFLESVALEWRDFTVCDPWIDRVLRLWQSHAPLLDKALSGRVIASIFAAMMWRRPEDPAMEEWAQRLQASAIATQDVSQRVLLTCNLYVYYAVVTGDWRQAESLLKLAHLDRRPDAAFPLAQALWCSLRATGAWLSGDMKKSIALADTGSRIVRDNDLHVWDVLLATARVYATLTDGDVTRGAVFLEHLDELVDRDRAVDHAHLLYLRCLHEIDADPAAAVEIEREANARARAAGGLQQIVLGDLALAQALHALDRTDEAHALLRPALERSRRMRSHVQVFQALLCGALFALDSNDDVRCARDLEEALHIGQRYAIVNFSFFRPRMMARLLVRARRLELAPEARDYVATLIAKRGLDSLMDEAEETTAPVRIYTMGRFEVSSDDGRIALGDPVEAFLKTMASLGSEGEEFMAVVRSYMPSSTTSTALRFQQQAQGGKHVRNDLPTVRGRVEAWISRVREDLPEDVIDRSQRRIRIRSDVCWVDAFAIEQLAQRYLADTACSPLERSRLRARVARLSAAGLFLPDEGTPRILAMRTRLETLRSSVAGSR